MPVRPASTMHFPQSSSSSSSSSRLGVHRLPTLTHLHRLGGCAKDANQGWPWANVLSECENSSHDPHTQTGRGKKGKQGVRNQVLILTDSALRRRHRVRIVIFSQPPRGVHRGRHTVHHRCISLKSYSNTLVTRSHLWHRTPNLDLFLPLAPHSPFPFRSWAVRLVSCCRPRT